MSARNTERDRYPSEWVDPKDPRKLLQGAYDDVWGAVRKAVGVEIGQVCVHTKGPDDDVPGPK